MSPTSLAVTDWYASHSIVRRLWAIEHSRGIRVIVALEPTLDGDDVHPAWIANSQAWIHDLQSQVDSPVELELIDAHSSAEIRMHGADTIVANLCWRDPSES